MISLCYILFFVLNNGELPFLVECEEAIGNNDNSEIIDMIIILKKKHSLMDMLASLELKTHEHELLKSIIQEIESMTFESKPKYDNSTNTLLRNDRPFSFR